MNSIEIYNFRLYSRWSLVYKLQTYILSHVISSYIIMSLDKIAVKIIDIFFAPIAVVSHQTRNSLVNPKSSDWYYTHAEYARQISMTTTLRHYQISALFIVHTGRIIIIILYTYYCHVNICLVTFVQPTIIMILSCLSPAQTHKYIVSIEYWRNVQNKI